MKPIDNLQFDFTGHDKLENSLQHVILSLSLGSLAGPWSTLKNDKNFGFTHLRSKVLVFSIGQAIQGENLENTDKKSIFFGVLQIKLNCGKSTNQE